MAAAVMEQIPVWSIPREWPGERCFILCGGESITQQRRQIAQLQGRIIAVKHGVLLRPDADVLFVTAEAWDVLPLLPKFRGTHVVVRGARKCPEIPAYVHRVTPTKDHTRLCELRTHVCGLDAGTSAIDLAYKFGATEIVLLGYDMTGGRWFCDSHGRGEWAHPMPTIPQQHFRRHLQPLPAFAADAQRKGIRIVNCSPTSVVTVFERQPLETFL